MNDRWEEEYDDFKANRPIGIDAYDEKTAKMFNDAMDSRHWLEWFFQNADFGPADTDVRMIMQEQYEKETGRLVPDDYRVPE